MTPELHPLTQKYPPMEADEFAAFQADLAAHGQKNPIWLFEGKVLDGRNRLRACLELGLEPVFAEFAGTESEAAAFVDSQNLHRRHLSREWRQQRVREMRDQGQSSRSIARELGCSHFTVLRDLASAGEAAPTGTPARDDVSSLDSAEPLGKVATPIDAGASLEAVAPDPKRGVVVAEPKLSAADPDPVGRHLPTGLPEPKGSLGRLPASPERAARHGATQSESVPALQPSSKNPRIQGRDGKSYRAERPAAPKPKPAPKENAQWSELASVLTELAQKVETLVPTPAENEKPWELISSLEATARSLLRQAERLKRRHHL